MSKKRITFYFILYILSMWPIAIGLRFIVACISNQIYIPNLFDLFFDWLILFIYGFLSYTYFFYKIVMELMKHVCRYNGIRDA